MTHEGRGTDCLDQRDPLVCLTELSGDMLDRGRPYCLYIYWCWYPEPLFFQCTVLYFYSFFFHFIYRYLATRV